jgi:hypothetical protein
MLGVDLRRDVSLLKRNYKWPNMEGKGVLKSEPRIASQLLSRTVWSHCVSGHYTKSSGYHRFLSEYAKSDGADTEHFYDNQPEGTGFFWR